MAGAQVSMEVGNDGVAIITLSNPPVNDLDVPLIWGLKEKYEEAMKRNDVKAIVMTGDNGKFLGGFDNRVFERVHKTGDLSILPNVSIELLVNVIEDGPKPSVAAIQGHAIGGGLELAMVCHARISTPKAQLGLHELSIGVIPGFGGTQRLPRLVGVEKAVEMMLSSKPITSEEGLELGLIDAIVPSQELLNIARLRALDIAEGRKPLVRSLHMTNKLGPISESREFLNIAKQNAKKTAPNMPQHQACLDTIEEGLVHGGYAGLLKEGEVDSVLVLSDVSKRLVQNILAQRST
ncbi:peroxisomal fatty acid beta-oxidation multifunctional protein AIM1-like [Amaranthus tricolor]|uniref:peroxisomal fatty acid beta-oxidation multifunctional protein AIM1-like n=1 Tax=Amaranthus tricolor TaxID=29722 RepID=UPI00258B07C7|nr:peroxisomal fatty acid beta-oxidation multifunctional protein AIM1-like [Amaranthus tricolor]